MQNVNDDSIVSEDRVEKAKKAFKIPESLAGIGIVWKNYEPTGGWGWNGHVRFAVIPALQAGLDSIKKSHAAYEYKTSRVSRVSEALATIGNEIHVVREFFESYQDIKSRNAIESAFASLEGKTETVWDWVLKADERLATLGGRLGAHKEDDSIKNDFDADERFLNSAIKFIEEDFGFDALVYGLFHADAKYRTKIFRTIKKAYANISATRAMVERSPSKLRSLVVKDGRLGELNELFKVYDTVGEFVKALGKRLASDGNSFWTGRFEEMKFDANNEFRRHDFTVNKNFRSIVDAMLN